MENSTQKSPAPAIPETMWCLELRGAGFESLALAERPTPRPGPKEVLCRVEAVSPCALDVELVRLGRDHRNLFGWDLGRWPIVPGHEGSLIVAAVGEGIGHRMRVGQRLAISPDFPGPPRYHIERYGESPKHICRITLGCTIPGLLAQYVLLREDVLDSPGNLVLIDTAASSLPHFGVALAEPFSTVVAAHAHMVHVVKGAPDGERSYRAGIQPGGICVVVGAGPMGLLHACYALLRRPRHLVVSEPNPARREAADRLKLLADVESTQLHVVDPSELPAKVRAASGGRGATDIIIAAGSSRAEEDALALAGNGCAVSFFAVSPSGDGRVRVNTRDLHFRSASFSGTSGSDPLDLRRAVELQERGAVDLGPFVSAVGGIAAAPSALQCAAEGRFAGKQVIYPHVNAPGMVPVQEWGLEAERRFLSESA